MPLAKIRPPRTKDRCRKNVSKNIRMLMDEGRPQKQAVAIALSHARKQGCRIKDTRKGRAAGWTTSGAREIDFTPREEVVEAEIIEGFARPVLTTADGAVVYRLDPPYKTRQGLVDHALVSTVNNEFTRGMDETAIFPSTPTGKITSYHDIATVRRTRDPRDAFEVIGYHVPILGTASGRTRGKAVFLRSLSRSRDLYRLVPPHNHHEYVVLSVGQGENGATETAVFPSTYDGRIHEYIPFGDIVRGYEPKSAFASFGYSLKASDKSSGRTHGRSLGRAREYFLVTVSLPTETGGPEDLILGETESLGEANALVQGFARKKGWGAPRLHQETTPGGIVSYYDDEGVFVVQKLYGDGPTFRTATPPPQNPCRVCSESCDDGCYHAEQAEQSRLATLRRGRAAGKKEMPRDRSKKPTSPGCHLSVPGGHSKIAWTCRHCGTKSCASCAHQYGSARSPFTMKDAGDRMFTCGQCSHARARSGRSGGEHDAMTSRVIALFQRGVASVRGPEAPEDVLFQKARNAIKKSNPASLDGYAFISGRNWAIQEMKRAEAAPRVLQRQQEATRDQQEKYETLQRVRAELRQIIQSVPVSGRIGEHLKVIEMTYIDNLTPAQIEEKLGVSKNVVHKWKERGTAIVMKHASPELQRWLTFHKGHTRPILEESASRHTRYARRKKERRLSQTP